MAQYMETVEGLATGGIGPIIRSDHGYISVEEMSRRNPVLRGQPTVLCVCCGRNAQLLERFNFGICCRIK